MYNSLTRNNSDELLGKAVLVGRPNVGKSALFNSLTCSRSAIVGDHVGLTRDRRYGEVTWDNMKFTLVDCGGLLAERRSELGDEVEAQTKQAIVEADLLLLVVDAQIGWLQEDLTLAQRLRRTNKPVFLVVNKAEGWKGSESWQFAQLGIADCFIVSALQVKGLSGLRQAIVKKLLALRANSVHARDGLETVGAEKDVGSGSDPLKITFLGCPNVGKSTLINQIVGYERLVAAELPGTTRDSVLVPFTRNGDSYVLVDTAGIRRRSRIHEKVEEMSVAQSLELLRLADIAVLLIDATIGPRDQDLKLVEEITRVGKGLVIAVNKHDLVNDVRLVQLRDELQRKLAFIQHAPVVTISAKSGYGVSSLWRIIGHSLQAKSKRFNTARLNQILQKAVAHHPSALVNGRAVKLRYVHMGNIDPLQLIIHGVRSEGLSDSYQRYLENFFRRELGLSGFPIKLSFKDSHSEGR